MRMQKKKQEGNKKDEGHDGGNNDNRKKTKNTMAAAAIRGGGSGARGDRSFLAALGMCSQALCTARDSGGDCGTSQNEHKNTKKKVGGEKGWRGARRDEMQAAGG